MWINDPASTRDGFALPVALLAIMVIGAIVTGGFYASSQESRIATSTDLGNQAFYVAEYGLEEALGTWMNEDLADVGDTLVMDPVDVTSGGQTLGSYTLSVRRLGTTMFLVTSEGSVQAGPRTARREVGSIVRTLTPSMPAPTALAIFGGLTVGGNSYIRGNDNCTVGDTLAGVTAYDSSRVDSGNKDHITGKPPVAEDAALDTSALSDFGALNIDDLTAAATKIYEAGESENGMAPVTTTDTLGNTVCVDSVRSNWGDADRADPPGACESSFPIIHAKGDLHLKTGTGQGILIVDGDLQASGNFDFYGVVIVRGELATTGTGNHFEGSVIVQGHGNLDSESTTLGNSLVQYNRCTTESAFNAALRPRPLAGRAWMDFTAITRGEADDN
ncbi:MAG: pilus assembly PilX N-terminal domain-containing protein [Longimicrobiales bacterium]